MSAYEEICTAIALASSFDNLNHLEFDLDTLGITATREGLAELEGVSDQAAQLKDIIETIKEAVDEAYCSLEDEMNTLDDTIGDLEYDLDQLEAEEVEA
jgi:uncharacterized protein YdcH (DUF465 family)